MGLMAAPGKTVTANLSFFNFEIYYIKLDVGVYIYLFICFNAQNSETVCSINVQFERYVFFTMEKYFTLSEFLRYHRLPAIPE